MNATGLRPFCVEYTMRNGTTGTITTLAPTSCDALLIVLDHFGQDLGETPRRISVRPA